MESSLLAQQEALASQIAELRKTERTAVITVSRDPIAEFELTAKELYEAKSSGKTLKTFNITEVSPNGGVF